MQTRPRLVVGNRMQFDQLKRRDFIALLGSATVWPLATHTQQPAMPVIGYLGSASLVARYLAAFQQGLKETGFVKGQNVAIEYRWAEGHYDRLPALASDLVARQVTVIFATGGSAPAQSAKAATAKIPIVFESGGDPVTAGLVASLNRPGGNVTGVSWIASALGAKRLGLLHQLVPKAASVAVLMNPNYPEAGLQVQELQAAADSMKQQIYFLKASRVDEIDAAFTTLVQQGADALFVANDPFLGGRRDRIVALAARHALPAIYPNRDDALAGGLISYGTNLADMYRQAGVYTARILKGEKPADMPVMQPTKFEFRH